MALAPINTYASEADLSLGHVPQGADDNEALYIELLDMHNAIESSLTHSDANDLLSLRATNTVTADYTITAFDNVIFADGSSNSVRLLLPLAAENLGKVYQLKCIDDTFTVDVAVQGTDELEEETVPFELFKGEYIGVVSDGINWRVAA